MPFLNIKVSAPYSQTLSAKIASAVTGLTHEILGKNRELTAVTVEFVSPDNWYIGGESLAARAQRSFYLDIRVTEGTNTKHEMEKYVSRVFAAMESILGELSPVSYVVIHDVRADAWGFGGLTQEYRYIQRKAA